MLETVFFSLRNVQKVTINMYLVRLDRFDHGKIGVSDILEFITEYDLILSDEDLILFIKCNSINGDIILNYTELLFIYIL